MKICIITEYFPQSENFEIKGGAEGCAFNESYQLSKNHDIIVLTSKEKNVASEYEINGIKVICCGKNRSYVQAGSFLNRLYFMKDAYKIGKTLDIDLVIGYNFITHPVAWKVSQKLNIPSVARYHDMWIGKWFKNMGITGLFGEILERYNLSRDFDLIVSVSQYTQKKLEKYFPKEKIAVVPNIVDFPPVKAEKFKKPTISCVARLVEYKKIDDLIRAMNILIKEFPDLQCKIVGTGPLENRHKTLTKELKIEKNVHFCGFIEKHNDVLKIIKGSSIFCLPSIVEGFGIVIVEAMGCNVPFVAAEIPPVMEASGKKGGLFFKGEDWKDLAEKIKYLLQNPEIYKELQNEGYVQSQKYKGENIAQELETLYLQLIEKKEEKLNKFCSFKNK
ncbi:glycosyltransferase family 4 protein [Methanobacterium alcaliphilum]|uniref:glycosyltransferase family 4 protein n=1 Tax=Methanobacterium alcaliphilum TaxID=392018 RepID=UPI00200B1FE6|nr:glycosyltransferase family 4 protein [Methanobacterium alcaliphilum]MCK9152413.1 glycosyltransferase family 4 protein [Methanobacterium alcaliphilum]